MRHRVGLLATLTFMAANIAVGSARSATEPVRPTVDADGTVHVPAYALPESSLLGTDTRAELEKDRVRPWPPNACPSEKGADPARMPEIRRCEAEAFYQTPAYKHLRDLYPVVMTPQEIGGVYTEVFVPAEGVGARNAKRVLINLHGGAFKGGARTESHLESVPIAAIGKIKVVSVDYRQAPEYAFPAASEDVAKVYRELLKTYLPANIGIYGCSAGGLLTAQSIAWFQKEKLPMPGAVAMLCEGADYWTAGDAGLIAAAHGWWDSGDTIDANPYFKTTTPGDPLAFPVRSAQVMAGFPPSLLITSTRDAALSSVVYTHSVLVAHGVDAELHVWEGLRHAFFFDTDLPQSREVHQVTVKFFDTHLGL
jgi:acetyl esterase/lipase